MSTSVTEIKLGEIAGLSDQLLDLETVGRLLGNKCERSVRRLIDEKELPEPVYVRSSPALFASDVQAYMDRMKEKRNSKG